uniref:ORF16 n=1 Tax=Chlamydomonas reinhardtii TaxID=3055 RepID=Q99199_CHLRE|nr:unnamed protein product [Chlamydomonas reinhardtii]
YGLCAAGNGLRALASWTMRRVRVLMIRPVRRKQRAPHPCFMDNSRHTCPYDVTCVPQATASHPCFWVIDGIRALMIRPVCRKQRAPHSCVVDYRRH